MPNKLTPTVVLDRRNMRLKLPVSAKPVFVKVGPGVAIGYRRNRAAGSWVVRLADGKRGNQIKNIGFADDFAPADGSGILDYWQAQECARQIARTGLGGAAPPAAAIAQPSTSAPAAETAPATPERLTVAAALDFYVKDLRRRGRDPGNADRLRSHLPKDLVGKAVADLGVSELANWHAALVDGGKLNPNTINRLASIAKAVFNLARKRDASIMSARAWEVGLAMLPDADHPRYAILSEEEVRAVAAASYEQSCEFGLLVEVAAVTGARYDQICRLQVADLQPARTPPRLMVPRSRKGRGKKAISHQAVPVSDALAARLIEFVQGRPGDAPLLLKPCEYEQRAAGPKKVWTKPRLAAVAGLMAASLPIEEIARRLGTTKNAITGVIYRLRHGGEADPETIEEKEPTVVRKIAGGPWCKSDQLEPFARAVAAAGLPGKVTMYSLRHSSIVRQILANVPLRVVAVVHDTSVRILERNYSFYIGTLDETLIKVDLLDLPAPVRATNVVGVRAPGAAP